MVSTKTNIEKSIRLLKEKFKKNSNSSSWADNIIQASKHLKTQEEWAHFYHYLADPYHYDFEKIILGPSEVPGDNKFPFEDLDPRLTPVFYKNGDEVTIHLKNNASSCEPDEKTEE